VDSAFHGWNDIWLAPAFKSWNLEALLPRISCPLLAVQGYDDPYGTMAQIDGIAERVPQSRLLKLERCGHSPQRDQPDAVIAATRDLLCSIVH
jgi:pimeloyl-ACP methyl ester carboxylesterase